MGLSIYSYDTYISNDFSKLKKARIKPIRTKVKINDYLPNLVLGQIIQGRFEEKQYPLIFGLIRKTKFITKEYNSLTLKLRKFDPTRRKINSYFDIIYKTEVTILFCGQVIDILVMISGTKLFNKNDKSVYDRLYSLHNQVKHVNDELVKKKQIQVLKLDNDGIYTTGLRVEYDELRSFIVSLNGLVEKTMT